MGLIACIYSRPLAAQEAWTCSYVDDISKQPRIMKLEIRGNKVLSPWALGTFEWQVIVNNQFGLVAASGDAGEKGNETFVWGDLITINKHTLDFRWDSHVGMCIVG